jgi:hypothetical protein
MTHTLAKHHNDISDIARDYSVGQERGVSKEDMTLRMQGWADDIRKSDERGEHFRN